MTWRWHIVWGLMGSKVILRLLSVMLLVSRTSLHSLTDMMLSSMLLMNRYSSHVVHGRCRLMGRGPNHVWCSLSLLPNTDNHSWLILVHHLLWWLVSRKGPSARGQARATYRLVRPPYTLPMLESHRMMHLTSHLLSRSSQPSSIWG